MKLLVFYFFIIGKVFCDLDDELLIMTNCRKKIIIKYLRIACSSRNLVKFKVCINLKEEEIYLLGTNA